MSELERQPAIGRAVERLVGIAMGDETLRSGLEVLARLVVDASDASQALSEPIPEPAASHRSTGAGRISSACQRRSPVDWSRRRSSSPIYPVRRATLLRMSPKRVRQPDRKRSVCGSTRCPSRSCQARMKRVRAPPRSRVDKQGVAPGTEAAFDGGRHIGSLHSR